MDTHIEELFVGAKRFDESELTKREDYQLRQKITFLLEELAAARYGEDAQKFLEEYLMALYDVCHYEFLHYFEQGYLAAKAELGEA